MTTTTEAIFYVEYPRETVGNREKPRRKILSTKVRFREPLYWHWVLVEVNNVLVDSTDSETNVCKNEANESKAYNYF